MKIIYLIPGSGDKFYCENCIRDIPLINRLRTLGADVVVVPLYLPLFMDEEPLKEKVYYGAISTYLREKFSLFRNPPPLVRKIFDSKPSLKMAASMSGATTAKGLEDMTLSMLQGRDPRQESEFKRLLLDLEKEKPDMLHISNALLMGLGVDIKRNLNIPLVCSLQDEDTWLDSMEKKFRDRAWSIFESNAGYVDRFLPVSDYYREKILSKVDLDKDKFSVVPVGLDVKRYSFNDQLPKIKAIGYLSRITENYGLDSLSSVYIRLKKEIPELKLYITGGYTSGDKAFVKKIKRRLKNYIKSGDVIFIDEFHLNGRVDFFSKITLLSVPMVYGEAFGTYQIEAMVSGVPVVQPAIGGFCEVIKSTGGGITYSAGNSDEHYRVLLELLNTPEKVRELKIAGRSSVLKEYNLDIMAGSIYNIYEELKVDNIIKEPV